MKPLSQCISLHLLFVKTVFTPLARMSGWDGGGAEVVLAIKTNMQRPRNLTSREWGG